LHMAQLMPLPLTVSCFSKIQIGFTFLVPAHLGSPGQGAVKRMCVCVCVNVFVMGVVRNCKFGLYVNGSKSQPADDKSSLKGAWSGSRDTFLNFTPPEISLQWLQLQTSDWPREVLAFRCLTIPQVGVVRVT